MLVALYLIAIVLANQSVAIFGPWSTIANAFLFIGLDITTRDALHERWQHKNLWLKMGMLVATGSFLSWLINKDAGQIAVASMLAFAASGLADTIVYQVLGKWSRFVRVNGSNVVSSAVDSLVFPTVAFGGVIWWVTLGQFAAKVAGGFVWSLILRKLMWGKAAPTTASK